MLMLKLKGKYTRQQKENEKNNKERDGGPVEQNMSSVDAKCSIGSVVCGGVGSVQVVQVRMLADGGVPHKILRVDTARYCGDHRCADQTVSLVPALSAVAADGTGAAQSCRRRTPIIRLCSTFNALCLGVLVHLFFEQL